MAKSPELFPDMTKLMSDFDMSKLTDQFQQFMQQYKLPGVDVDALMAGQRKNMEALTNANRVAWPRTDRSRLSRSLRWASGQEGGMVTRR